MRLVTKNEGFLLSEGHFRINDSQSDRCPSSVLSLPHSWWHHSSNKLEVIRSVIKSLLNIPNYDMTSCAFDACFLAMIL